MASAQDIVNQTLANLKWNKKPADWLRGSKKVGETYTAYDTYGQGRPDFGKGAGPGEPYHEVQKKNTGLATPKPSIPNIGNIVSGANNSALPWGTPGSSTGDPRTDAIRRRLRGL